jgi:hypothetical protein
MAGYDPKQPRDEKGRWTTGSSYVSMGIAVTVVMSALAGGGAGGITSISGSTSEYGPRVSRSQSEARTGRNEPDARTKGVTDSFKITSRLEQRLGYKVTFRAIDDHTNCATYSDGEVHAFFLAHPCLSLHREIIAIQDKRNEIVFGMATIAMSDYSTALGLRRLLAHPGHGSITQLSPGGNSKYRHFTFIDSLTTADAHGATVIAYDVQVFSGVRNDAVLRLVLDNARIAVAY